MLSMIKVIQLMLVMHIIDEVVSKAKQADPYYTDCLGIRQPRSKSSRSSKSSKTNESSKCI
jgi:hypothetical protein